MRLFAAPDAQGRTRFVGEVPRGAACDCICPVCASPLVAKQGGVKEWHFAHEASQERVECEVGAMNMLRRLAAEVLQADGVPLFPPYRQELRSRWTIARELVQWDAQIVAGSAQWSTSGLASAPFLRGLLTTSTSFEAHIDISETYVRRTGFTGANASLVFWLPMPRQEDLFDRHALELHIRTKGYWFWQHHPDIEGRLQAAQLKLEQADRAAVERDEERWQILQGSRALAENPAHPPVTSDHEEVPDWLPGLKPNTALLCYALKDGQGNWVLYSRHDGTYRLVPYPPAPEGWDELFPPSVGTPDKDGGYAVPNFVGAVLFLAPRSFGTGSPTTPSGVTREFERIDQSKRPG